MRIVFNTAFADVTLAMQPGGRALADAQRQVASGLRIGRLSDDPLAPPRRSTSTRRSIGSTPTTAPPMPRPTASAWPTTPCPTSSTS